MEDMQDDKDDEREEGKEDNSQEANGKEDNGKEDDGKEDMAQSQGESWMPQEQQTIVIDVSLLCFSY